VTLRPDAIPNPDPNLATAVTVPKHRARHLTGRTECGRSPRRGALGRELFRQVVSNIICRAARVAGKLIGFKAQSGHVCVHGPLRSRYAVAFFN
jgi:hypothetical protein